MFDEMYRNKASFRQKKKCTERKIPCVAWSNFSRAETQNFIALQVREGMGENGLRTIMQSAQEWISQLTTVFLSFIPSLASYMHA